MTWVWWFVAGAVAFIAFCAWVVAFAPAWTRDRPEHPPEPALRAAQLRATDVSDPHRRPGDDDQWHRMRTLVRHINRDRNSRH